MRQLQLARTHSSYRSIGEYVVARRAALGLTQRRLGEQIGVARSFISHLERNRTAGYLPEPELVRRLAEALHCTVGDLLAAAGYADSLIPELSPSDPLLVYLTVHGQRLPDEAKQAILTLVKLYLDGDPAHHRE